MKISKSFIFLLFLQLISWNIGYSQVKRISAFPGAEGFGQYSTGGRGGDVYHVVNLNDSGRGSLRHGIETVTGPRTIVFDISGTIMLAKRLTINKPAITIAGQTAPGDGITLANNSFNISAGNVIVRYIRCRLGDSSGNAQDAVSVVSGSNIILDHITASWSVDETLSCQSNDVDSLTVQWCMITESLRFSNHQKGPHGYGGIIGSIAQTFHHNLYAHHSSRNPKVTGRRHCKVDFRNNVIYNWGFNSCYDGTASYMNWANNYYKAGPGTEDDKRWRIFQLSDKNISTEGKNQPQDSEKYETSLYAEGNYVHGFPEVSANNWTGGIVFTDDASEVRNRVQKPFIFPAITEQSAQDAFPLVIAGAGASKIRDKIDERIANEVINGSTNFGINGLIDSQMDVGGWPTLNSLPALRDSDSDGMPDFWEKRHGLNPNDPADRNNDEDKDGYTELEKYLNSLV